jgi:methionine synthase II (cobalamin-independent)
VDGRNTALDASTNVVDRVAATGIEEIHVQPSCGLDFLPRDRAKRKLQRLSELAA